MIFNFVLKHFTERNEQDGNIVDPSECCLCSLWILSFLTKRSELVVVCDFGRCAQPRSVCVSIDRLSKRRCLFVSVESYLVDPTSNHMLFSMINSSD